jgi:hypothetical protein
MPEKIQPSSLADAGPTSLGLLGRRGRGFAPADRSTLFGLLGLLRPVAGNVLDKGENQAPCEPDYLSIILASAQNDYDHPIRVIIRPDLPMLSEVDQATWVVPAPK